MLNAKYIIHSAKKYGDGRAASDSFNIQSVLAEYSIPDMSLSEILEDRTGFEAFMKHLVQEFSVENLLVSWYAHMFNMTLGMLFLLLTVF